MQFQKIVYRALHISAKYDKLNRQRNNQEWTGEHIAQGFVGDVGDLMKLIMAKEGLRKIDDVDGKLAHELADCLWSVIVLAEKYNIDLEKSFFSTMSDLEDYVNKQLD